MVDICSLDSADHPRAVGALAIDRSVHLFLDLSDDRESSSITFEGLTGTAYRILNARGHILLLTSEALYVLTDLAARFLRGETGKGPTMILRTRLHAVDAAIAFNRWLLIIMPDGSVRGSTSKN